MTLDMSDTLSSLIPLQCCRAGDQGSANATEAFRKLEGKVQQFMHEP